MDVRYIRLSLDQGPELPHELVSLARDEALLSGQIEKNREPEVHFCQSDSRHPSILELLPVPRLFLIDSFGFIFRAYHARARSNAPPMRTSGGLSTEAIFIFHNMLRKLTTAYKPD